MNKVDRLNLMDLAKKYPNKSIVIENGFFDGSNKKPFGFVPNNSDGQKLYFAYKCDVNKLASTQN